MKKTIDKNARKLALNRESIRRMSNLEIRAVQGGYIATSDENDPCTTAGRGCWTVSCIAC
jgi:hypothetical protein